MKLCIYPQEICQSPYYILAEVNDKENQLNKTMKEQASNDRSWYGKSSYNIEADASATKKKFRYINK